MASWWLLFTFDVCLSSVWPIRFFYVLYVRVASSTLLTQTHQNLHWRSPLFAQQRKYSACVSLVRNAVIIFPCNVMCLWFVGMTDCYFWTQVDKRAASSDAVGSAQVTFTINVSIAAEWTITRFLLLSVFLPDSVHSVEFVACHGKLEVASLLASHLTLIVASTLPPFLPSFLPSVPLPLSFHLSEHRSVCPCPSFHPSFHPSSFPIALLTFFLFPLSLPLPPSFLRSRNTDSQFFSSTFSCHTTLKIIYTFACDICLSRNTNNHFLSLLATVITTTSTTFQGTLAVVSGSLS